MGKSTLLLSEQLTGALKEWLGVRSLSRQKDLKEVPTGDIQALLEVLGHKAVELKTLNDAWLRATAAETQVEPKRLSELIGKLTDTVEEWVEKTVRKKPLGEIVLADLDQLRAVLQKPLKEVIEPSTEAPAAPLAQRKTSRTPRQAEPAKASAPEGSDKKEEPKELGEPAKKRKYTKRGKSGEFSPEAVKRILKERPIPEGGKLTLTALAAHLGNVTKSKLAYAFKQNGIKGAAAYQKYMTEVMGGPVDPKRFIQGRGPGKKKTKAAVLPAEPTEQAAADEGAESKSPNVVAAARSVPEAATPRVEQTGLTDAETEEDGVADDRAGTGAGEPELTEATIDAALKELGGGDEKSGEEEEEIGVQPGLRRRRRRRLGGTVSKRRYSDEERQAQRDADALIATRRADIISGAATAEPNKDNDLDLLPADEGDGPLAGWSGGASATTTRRRAQVRPTGVVHNRVSPQQAGQQAIALLAKAEQEGKDRVAMGKDLVRVLRTTSQLGETGMTQMKANFATCLQVVGQAKRGTHNVPYKNLITALNIFLNYLTGTEKTTTLRHLRELGERDKHVLKDAKEVVGYWGVRPESRDDQIREIGYTFD